VVRPPRFQHLPAGAVSSRGAEAIALAGNAGLDLSAEQMQVLHGGLGVRADGSWAAFEVANVQPRQNGKSSTLQARILLGLSLGEQIAYTCHRVDSAQEIFRGLVDLVEVSPELSPLLDRVSYANGKESIRLQNGGRVVFGTRSSRTGRGFSLDLILMDEAHILSEHAHTALLPATSARGKRPQVWYAASSVDEQVNEHGLVLARLRERGTAGEAENLAYFEWSAALLDDDGNELRPEQVRPEMVDDEELWYQANPALGSRISVEHIRAEREAMDPRGWLVERLGVGAWPDTSGVASSPISGEEWAELQDRDSKLVGEMVLAFDVAPDRRCALVVCGRRGVDDLLHVELLRSSSGTSWLQDELERLSDRYDVREVVADDYGGNRALVSALEEAGLRVRTLTGGEHASACGKLLDLVAEQGFRHIGQPELVAALRGAKAKPVGDAWAWSRKASTGDAAVVVALTVALAAGAEIPADAADLSIY
jgi:phage terminase large subunit-like protein